MSLLSQFGDNGAIGGSSFSFFRCVPIAGQSGNSDTGGYPLVAQISSYPTKFAARQDDYQTIGDPIAYRWVDIATGVSQIYVGSAKTAATATYGGLILPFSDTLIQLDPVAGTTNIRYSTDYGLTWTNTGFTGNLAASWVQRQFIYSVSPGWWDGTYAQFQNVSGPTTIYTTNGSSYNSNPTAFKARACLPGNNYSAYSGYYFSSDSIANYWYRTSWNGSDTQVSGYTLMGMSPNGRYLVRMVYSNNKLEYSNDGGGSWSSFTNSLAFSAIGKQNVSIIPDDDGVFWIVFMNGNCFYYDFTVNRFVSTGSFEKSPDYLMGAFRVGGGGSSVPPAILMQDTFYSGGYQYFLADAPRKRS